MKLKNVARYFDDDKVYDAHTNALLFKAQFSSYEGSQPDGSVQRRRVMSHAPGTVMPAKRVIKVNDEIWITATPLVDGWKGQPIRLTTACRFVTDTFYVLTPGQAALRATTGVTQLYSQIEYLKDTVNTLTESDYDPQYKVTTGEPLADGAYLRNTQRTLRVRSPYSEPSGFFEAVCDEIVYAQGGPFTHSELYGRTTEVDVTFSTTYDPVTEVRGGTLATTGILMDFNKAYRYYTQADHKNASGDMVLIVAKSAVTPITGMPVTINTLNWRIINVTPNEDAWNVHVRKV